MVDYQLLVDRFKSDVLSFSSINKKQGMTNESFILLEKSLIKNFAMKDCFLFRVSHDVLKPNFKEYKFSFELTFSEVQPYLNGQQVIEIPDVFSAYSYFQHYTHAVPLMVEEEILAILIFSYEDATLQVNLTQEMVKEISSVYRFILRSYEVHSNENKYRKLYNITDLSH